MQRIASPLHQNHLASDALGRIAAMELQIAQSFTNTVGERSKAIVLACKMKEKVGLTTADAFVALCADVVCEVAHGRNRFGHALLRGLRQAQRAMFSEMADRIGVPRGRFLRWLNRGARRRLAQADKCST